VKYVLNAPLLKYGILPKYKFDIELTQISSEGRIDLVIVPKEDDGNRPSLLFEFKKYNRNYPNIDEYYALAQIICLYLDYVKEDFSGAICLRGVYADE